MSRMRVSRWAGEATSHQDKIKPSIAIGNYSLAWNANSTGILQSEESNLRTFLRDLVPHISSNIFKACGDLHSGIRRYAKDPREASRLEEAFNPRVLLSRSFMRSSFFAVIDAEGKTLISKREPLYIETSAEQESDRPKSSSLYVEGELGELIFDRHAKAH